MKTTERFDNAVSKLYTAFHNNELNAFSCTACAVGNLLNKDGSWENGFIGERFFSDSQLKISGYSSDELNRIEIAFMWGTRNKKDLIKHSHGIGTGVNKETQFKGLCAVVEYLCELDNIPNVMDYTKLFESENNEPKYQLQN